MILSNHVDTQLGQGLIFESADLIKSFKNLEKQAFALARAEGIWKEDEKEPKIRGVKESGSESEIKLTEETPPAPLYG